MALKKKTKKKASKKSKSTEPVSQCAAFADRARRLLEDVEAFATDFRKELGMHDAARQMPQGLIATVVYAQQIGAALAPISTGGAKAAPIWHASGGFDKVQCSGHELAIVEHGTTAGSRSPSWKTEACKQAEALAKVKNEPFEKSVYVASVQNATPRSAGSEWFKFKFVG